MSVDDFFDSGERLLNADELAECVTRQKTFSLPVIGQKVKKINMDRLFQIIWLLDTQMI
jgi:hypothetical protein